jgi:hypothetical protein
MLETINQTAKHHISEDHDRVSTSLNTQNASFLVESSHCKQNKEKETQYMPIVGFEQATPVFAVNVCPNCYYIFHRLVSGLYLNKTQIVQ